MHALLSAPELQNLLANAVMFVDKTKNSIDILDGVLLHEVNGSLAAIATDRYRMAEILGEVSEIEPAFRLFVTADQAKTMIDFLKPLLKDKVNVVRLEWAEDRRSFTLSNLWAEVWAEDEDDLRLITDEDHDRKALNLFNARNLFPADPFHANNEHGMTHAPVEHLASFARVKDRRQAPNKNDTMLVIASAEPKKPSVILRGDWFRGLIMPRISGLWRDFAMHNQSRFL